MASFMFFARMLREFVKPIKRLIIEFTFRMACESREGDILHGVAGSKMRREFAGCVEDMFVREDFFVLCAEGTGGLAWE